MKRFLILMACAVGAIQGLAAQSVISPGRAINITIKGVGAEEAQKFNGTYPVSESGMISLPNLDSPIRAGGLSGSQLARTIEAAYRSAQIYRAPSVQVITNSDDTVAEFSVTIGGQVRQPGPRKYTQGMTLYQAVSAGGGATEFGSMFRVSLIRNGKAREIDLTKNENKSLLVEPNDTIEVPQKNFLGR
jgi:protein involved in polysaccharide export with SLBB domain